LELVSWSWNLTDAVVFQLKIHRSSLLQTSYSKKVRWSTFILTCQYNFCKCLFQRWTALKVRSYTLFQWIPF